MEHDMVHPSFLDQPFVNVPNHYPDEDIDFSAGEVVYENPQAGEWGRLGMLAAFQFSAFSYLLQPFAHLFTTNIPSAESVNSVGRDFWDKNHLFYDSMSIGELTLLGVGGLSVFVFANIANNIAKKFPKKIQLSKNRDLVFITSVDLFGREEEKTYELANLEHVTPSYFYQKNWSANNPNGFMALHCLQGVDEKFLCIYFIFILKNLIN